MPAVSQTQAKAKSFASGFMITSCIPPPVRRNFRFSSKPLALD
jgi:hypothetical protein